MLEENWHKKALKSFFAIIIFWYSFIFQYIPLILLKIKVQDVNSKLAVVLSTFSGIVVMAILFTLYHKDLKKDFIKFKNNFLKNVDIGVKYWISGLLVMVISNLILTFLLKAGGANNEEQVQSMIKVFPLLMVIDAGIIAPFNEEIVFRKTLKDVIKNKWFFVILSFLFFGGAHVFNSATSFTDYLYIIPYGALGAAFALAYYKTDTIFTSMFLHIVHNTILCLISIIAL